MTTKIDKRVAQGVETRDALLVAARELFGERGYAATSTGEIVDRAGVTKGALYHHFADKEQVFRAVFEQVQREVSDAAVAEFNQSDSWAALLVGCRLWVEAHAPADVRQIALIDARVVLGVEGTREIETKFTIVALRGALRKAMNVGIIERQPLRPLSTMLYGALSQACLYIALSDDPDTARAEVADVIESLLTGLQLAPTGAEQDEPA